MLGQRARLVEVLLGDVEVAVGHRPLAVDHEALRARIELRAVAGGVARQRGTAWRRPSRRRPTARSRTKRHHPATHPAPARERRRSPRPRRGLAAARIAGSSSSPVGIGGADWAQSAAASGDDGLETRRGPAAAPACGRRRRDRDPRTPGVPSAAWPNAYGVALTIGAASRTGAAAKTARARRRRRRRAVGGPQRVDLARGPAAAGGATRRRRRPRRRALRRAPGARRCPGRGTGRDGHPRGGAGDGRRRRADGSTVAPRRRARARRSPPAARRSRPAVSESPRADLLGQDGALQLAERQEGQLAGPRSCCTATSVRRRLADARRAHLELVAAVGAPHRRAAPADERVVELVLGLAALALDVHHTLAPSRARSPTLRAMETSGPRQASAR